MKEHFCANKKRIDITWRSVGLPPFRLAVLIDSQTDSAFSHDYTTFHLAASTKTRSQLIRVSNSKILEWLSTKSGK